MIYTKWILLYAVCLLTSCNSAFSKAIEEDTEVDAVDTDYLGDDYEYDPDDDSSKPIENNNQPDVPLDNGEPPYFEQTEFRLHGLPGADIIINCDVRNFQISNTVIWYKDRSPITNGNYAINDRVEVMKNNSIVLRNVNPEDAGDYFCVVLPTQIRMHASLVIGGRLTIFVDGRDVTGRSTIFRQGEKHTIECKTMEPLTIKWSFDGQRAENVVNKEEDGKLFIEYADSEHAGIFQCLGDDGSHDPPHGMVNIEVQYIPKVSTHRHHINTKAGENAEMYCEYKANPIAITSWYRNGEMLSISEKYSIRNTNTEEGHNRTILTVKDVRKGDLDEYVCHVENTIGSNENKVHLTYEPENPHFESMDIIGNRVILHWLVRSIQPLSEAVLDYKMQGSYTWSTVSVIHTQRHSENSGMWKITHEMELMPGEWHTRVKTKNTAGWSKFSSQHEFLISSDEEEDSTDELPPDNIVRAGFGSGNGAASAISSMSSIVIITVATLFFKFYF